MYSVVVPTYNRARMLVTTLESLLAQEGGLPYEIIVVDNNSSDDTRGVVQSFERRAPGRLRYLPEATQGVSSARNAGIGAAQGEIIAFTEDDAIPDSNWLRSIAKVYQTHSDAWCVGGKIVLRLPEACPHWFHPTKGHFDVAGLLSYLDLGDDTVKLKYPEAVWAGNFSVRREALSVVGLFNARLGRIGTRLLSGGELELCLRIHRAGGAIYYSGQAIVTHLVPPARMTKRCLRERAYWRGRTDRDPLVHDKDLSLSERAREAFVMAKDCVKMLLFYAIINDRRGFECELAARRRLGYLQEDLRMLLDGKKAAAVSLPDAERPDKSDRPEQLHQSVPH